MTVEWSASEWQLLHEAADQFEGCIEDMQALVRLIRRGKVVESAPLFKDLTNKLKAGSSSVSLAHRQHFLEE